MPSRSLLEWQTVRSQALDEIEYAHRGVAHSRRGSRYATQQVNHAYVVLLASQFQGFCRELHSECIDFVVNSIIPPARASVCEEALKRNRALDRGNANPANLGSDFGIFRINFWDKVVGFDARNSDRRDYLYELNRWRNAIAHHDFNPAKLGSTVLRVRRVRAWRAACEQLAISFDEVLHRHFATAMGVSPW
jgi:hypothetical protein